MAEEIGSLLVAGLQLRWLFGHDVFISYSRADGLAFASSLAFKLGASKASAYADVFGSEPAAKTPADVLRALRGAKVLVVLCTPGALRSAAVLDEIRQFPAGRPVVPVCWDVEPSALAAWSDRLQGLAVSAEHPDALAQAGPSEALVRRVAEAAGRWRQAKRLRWTIGSAA